MGAAAVFQSEVTAKVCPASAAAAKTNLGLHVPFVCFIEFYLFHTPMELCQCAGLEKTLTNCL